MIIYRIYSITMHAEVNIIVIRQSKFKNVIMWMVGIQAYIFVYIYLQTLFTIMLADIFTFSPKAKIHF